MTSNGYEVEYIILTTATATISAAFRILELWKCPLVGHKADIYLFNDARENLSLEFMGQKIEFIPDVLVEDGDVLKVGNMN